MTTEMIRYAHRIGRVIQQARRDGKNVLTRNRRLVLITDNRNAKMKEIRAARGMS
jgi:hypothetical protein